MSGALRYLGTPDMTACNSRIAWILDGIDSLQYTIKASQYLNLLYRSLKRIQSKLQFNGQCAVTWRPSHTYSLHTLDGDRA